MPVNNTILNDASVLWGIDDTQSQDVYVPEWKVTIRIKALTGTERDQFEQSVVQTNGRKRDVNILNIRAKLIQISAIKEDGSLLFSKSDIEKLGLKTAAAVDRLFTVAKNISGMSEDDIEELAGNSVADQSDETTSDGPLHLVGSQENSSQASQVKT